MEQVTDINVIEEITPGSEQVVDINGISEMSDDFFRELDQNLEPNLKEHEPSVESPAVSPQKGRVTLATEPEKVEVSHDYEKRYKDSSREAMRLKSQLDEIAPFTPVLAALKDNAGLRSHMLSYYENPSNPRENLKLSEDFVFDMDEAIASPESESARVLNHMVDSRSQMKLNNFRDEQSVKDRELEMKAEEREFRSAHSDMSDTDYEDMVAWSKSTPMGLETIYYLYNRDHRDQTIADQTRESMANQMRSARKLPASVAAQSSVQSGEQKKSVDDQVVDFLHGIDGELDQMMSG